MIHFGLVKGLKTVNSFKPNNLGLLFRLHYQYACAILIGFCLIICSKQLSDSIDCFDSAKYPRDVIDNYCLLHGTFTTVTNNTFVEGKQISHHGIGRYTGNESVISHQYYQWTGMAMMTIALIMYIPYMICQQLAIGAEAKEENRRIIEEASHDISVKSKLVILPEVLNTISILLQFWILNSLLNYQFKNYGFHFLNFYFSEAAFPDIFPRVTKCTIRIYGNSGDVGKLDSVCLLLYNNVNEKLFLIIWFMFAMLLVCDIISILYKILLVLNSMWPVSSLIMKCKQALMK